MMTKPAVDVTDGMTADSKMTMREHDDDEVGRTGISLSPHLFAFGRLLVGD